MRLRAVLALKGGAVRGGVALWAEGAMISLTTTVEGHTASASKVMLLNALLVDGLLGDDIASAKED